MHSIRFVRAAKAGYILLSAVFCLCGALALSGSTLLAVRTEVLWGILLIGFGIVRLAGYFSGDLYRLAFQHDLALGILLVVLGSAALDDAAQDGMAQTLILGVSILADGLFKLQTAFDAKQFGLKSWILILLLGIAACGFGGVTAFCDDHLGLMPGAALLAEGVLNLCTALFAVKVVRSEHRMTPYEKQSKEEL